LLSKDLKIIYKANIYGNEHISKNVEHLSAV